MIKRCSEAALKLFTSDWSAAGAQQSRDTSTETKTHINYVFTFFALQTTHDHLFPRDSN